MWGSPLATHAECWNSFIPIGNLSRILTYSVTIDNTKSSFLMFNSKLLYKVHGNSQNLTFSAFHALLTHLFVIFMQYIYSLVMVVQNIEPIRDVRYIHQ